jgi:hypothetical protein
MEILEAASCNSLGGQWLATVPGIPKPKVKFECEFVAESRDPIRGSSGPFIVATKTFDEVEGKQFDIILVPAGKSVLTRFIYLFGAETGMYAQAAFHSILKAFQRGLLNLSAPKSREQSTSCRYVAVAGR